MGIILLFVGVVVLVFGLTQHLKGKRILAAPFKKTGEIVKDPTSPDPKGAMSTEGNVVAATPLVSPCSKTPCLAYSVEITREWEKQEQTQEGVKTKSGSTKAEGLKQGMTFQLDDGSGAVPVDCSKADVIDFDTTKNGFDDKVKIGAFVPGELVFGELHMQTPSLPSGERTTAFRAIEKVVPVGGKFFVLGKLENGTLGKPGWRSMMFSSKGRDGLLASTAKKKKFSFIGGGVAAVASIPLMIFGPSAPPSTRCQSQLAGAVAHCTDNLTSASGETYTWTVAKAGTYQLAVVPPEGMKNGLDPQLVVADSTGAEILDQTAEDRGQKASGSREFAAGTYKISVKDVDGRTVKGGFDYALEISGGPAGAAAAPAPAGAVADAKPAAEEAKPASGKPTILGTCLKKAEGLCSEYYGMVPELAPSMCKDEGGEFKEDAECPKENLVGTCHYKASAEGEPGQFENFYGAAKHDAAKKECADMAKEWADAPSTGSGQAGEVFASMDAPVFLAEYLKGKPAADAKFAGKTVVLKGLVSSVDKDVEDKQYVVFNPGFKFSAQAFFAAANEKQAQGLKVNRLASVKCQVRAQGSNLDLDDANILLDDCSVEAAKGKTVAAAGKAPAKKAKKK